MIYLPVKHFLNTNDVCGFFSKKVNQIVYLHVEAHIVCAHSKLLHFGIVLKVSATISWCLKAGVKMGTSPAQVPLKVVAGFYTGCTLDTKTKFVHFTWHYDERIDCLFGPNEENKIAVRI